MTFTGKLDTLLDPERPGLQDEEVLAIAGAAGNDYLATAECRDRILTRWLQRAELTDRRDLGDSQIEYDLQHGPGPRRKQTARIRWKGLHELGTSSFVISGGVQESDERCQPSNSNAPSRHAEHRQGLGADDLGRRRRAGCRFVGSVGEVVARAFKTSRGVVGAG